jgi:hypothetical protein
MFSIESARLFPRPIGDRERVSVQDFDETRGIALGRDIHVAARIGGG